MIWCERCVIVIDYIGKFYQILTENVCCNWQAFVMVVNHAIFIPSQFV